MKFSKTYKRIISFLLVLVTLSAALIGCKEDKENTKETESSVPSLTIVSEGESEYIILRSINADSTERQAALDLRNAIKEKCGATLEIVDDSQASDKKAICVGGVNRQGLLPFGPEQIPGECRGFLHEQTQNLGPVYG
jgi:hypothetical protein